MNPYNKNEKICEGGDKCKHIKCKCGHCKNYHIFGWECMQLERETLKQCECKQFIK